MRTLRPLNIALILAAGATLGGCSSYYGGYGGYGGRSGVSIGIGTGGGYYDPYYGGAYYGGSPYWGWNDGFYYPGTGYYVYDRYRQPHRWTAAQQRYWTERRAAIDTTATTTTSTTATTTTSTTSTKVRPNWSGFSRPRTTTTATVTRPDRQERIQARSERRQSSKSGVSMSTERSRQTRPD